MKKIGTLFLLLFGFSVFGYSQILSESELKTFTLSSPILEVGNGGMKRSENADHICFDFVTESEVTCGRHRWDLIYGHMRAGDEWDWFQVPGSRGVRSKIKNIGRKDWTDEITILEVEPYPELKPGEFYHVTVDASGRDGAPGKPGAGGRTGTPGMNGDGTVAESREQEPIDDADAAMAPAGPKPVSTSSHIVKAVEGHMYVMRVKDENNDFYVLLRVDEIVRGRSATISWRRIEAPSETKWKQL